MRDVPLFLIDIAVPRDIDPAVGALDDVFLYDIDDLQAVVDADIAERRQRAAHAEALVREEAIAFAARRRTQQAAAPVVRDLRAKHRAIVEDEKNRLRSRADWTPEQWRAIEATLQAIENKTLHEPTVKIREYAAAIDDAQAVAKIETARELFGLTAEDAKGRERDSADSATGHRRQRGEGPMNMPGSVAALGFAVAFYLSGAVLLGANLFLRRAGFAARRARRRRFRYRDARGRDWPALRRAA